MRAWTPKFSQKKSSSHCSSSLSFALTRVEAEEMRSILCAISLCALLSGAESSMFDAIRNGDTARVEALLKSGADPNQRHETGATALMYAAAFSTDECLRVLLAAGAQVNGSGNNGATALMWGTGYTAKVRMLLERGAEVNAKTK